MSHSAWYDELAHEGACSERAAARSLSPASMTGTASAAGSDRPKATNTATTTTRVSKPSESLNLFWPRILVIVFSVILAALAIGFGQQPSILWFGLKIMGFVSQAGEDRGRVFTLNLVYVLGILSVFALPAVFAATGIGMIITGFVALNIPKKMR